jgi:uncharacterized protein YcfL
MKHLFTILFAVLLFAACTDKKENPADVEETVGLDESLNTDEAILEVEFTTED